MLDTRPRIYLGKWALGWRRWELVLYKSRVTMSKAGPVVGRYYYRVARLSLKRSV